jgi:Zn-dependent protease with chaperone function
VVVTSGALQRLPEAELAAVLAHERAHAAARHHRLCAIAGVLRHAYPRVPVFAQAQDQVARLVELCADAVAARAHSPLALARALVTMAEAAAAPTGVLPASGGNTKERITRLLQPPRAVPVRVRAALAAAFLALPLLPVMDVLAQPVTHLTAFAW